MARIWLVGALLAALLVVSGGGASAISLDPIEPDAKEFIGNPSPGVRLGDAWVETTYRAQDLTTLALPGGPPLARAVQYDWSLAERAHAEGHYTVEPREYDDLAIMDLALSPDPVPRESASDRGGLWFLFVPLTLGVSAVASAGVGVRLRGITTQADGTPLLRAGPRFNIEQELGRGGFARAYRAHDRLLDRPVVLKKPLPGVLPDAKTYELFLQEARIAAKVSHPNVLTIHETIQEGDGSPIMVVEYAQGGTLAEWVLENGPLSVADAVRCALGILDGLAAIHDADIVHCDLKLSNIFLDSRGHPKIADFGIAHYRPLQPEGGPLAAGTPSTMSPEQLDGLPLDKRSDVYAMGALLYTMVTGRCYLPLEGKNDEEVRATVQTGQPEFPPEEFPPGFARVLRKALEKKPEDRWAGARDMWSALIALSHEKPRDGGVPRDWMGPARPLADPPPVASAAHITQVTKRSTVAAGGPDPAENRNRARFDPDGPTRFHTVE